MSAGERLCGIVLEVRGRYARLLVEGSFVRLPAAEGWRVGDEVWLLPDQLVAPSSRGRWGSTGLRWTAIAALTALAAGTASLGFVEVAAAQQVAAVVSVDINPSVDLYVNKMGTVLRTTSFDPGGQRIVEQAHVRGTPLAEALPALVSQATRDGYLSSIAPPSAASTPSPSPSSPVGAATAATEAKTSAHTVLVVVAGTHTAPLPTELSGAVDQGIEQSKAWLQKDDVDASLEVAQAPAVDVQGAAQEHLSLGRYAVGQALAASGKSVSVAELHSAALSVLLQGPVVSGTASRGKGQPGVRSSSSSSSEGLKSSGSSAYPPSPKASGSIPESLPVLPSVNQLVHWMGAQASTKRSSSHGPHTGTDGRSTSAVAATVGRGAQTKTGARAHPTGTEPSPGIGRQVGGDVLPSLATRASSKTANASVTNNASSSTSSASHHSKGDSAGSGNSGSVGQIPLPELTVGKPPGRGSNPLASMGHGPSGNRKDTEPVLRLGPSQTAGSTTDASSRNHGRGANHAGGGSSVRHGGP